MKPFSPEAGTAGLALAVFISLAAPLIARDWVDNTGRKLEGEMIAADADMVTFVIGGKEMSFPRKFLSKADQEHVEEWIIEQAAKRKAEAARASGIAEDGSVLTAELTDPRPDSTGPPADFEAVIESEDAENSEYVYTSPHFRFTCDRRLTGRVVTGFSRLYEATFEAVRAMPWGTRLNARTSDGLFPVKLFSQEEDFIAAGGIPGSAGTASGTTSLVQLRYLGVKDTGVRLILEDIEDSNVLIHELTHALRDEADRGLPVWMIEGSAEYIACAPYQRSGKFSFKDHLANAARCASRRGTTGGVFKVDLGLEGLLNADRPTFYMDSDGGLGKGAGKNYGASILVVAYFWDADRGKDGDKEAGAPIRSWLAAIRAGQSEAESRPLLLDGRTYEELKEEIRRAYRRDLEVEFND